MTRMLAFSAVAPLWLTRWAIHFEQHTVASIRYAPHRGADDEQDDPPHDDHDSA
jgi:hypothetical protein